MIVWGSFLLLKTVKGIIREQVNQISTILHKIGCRCVLDESKRVVHKRGYLVCISRFDPCLYRLCFPCTSNRAGCAVTTLVAEDGFGEILWVWLNDTKVFLNHSLVAVWVSSSTSAVEETDGMLRQKWQNYPRYWTERLLLSGWSSVKKSRVVMRTQWKRYTGKWCPWKFCLSQAKSNRENEGSSRHGRAGMPWYGNPWTGPSGCYHGRALWSRCAP